MRPQRLSRGFTLVELLVVIAIIGILAGLIAAGLPRALEAARLANAENNFTQIRTILVDYNTKHGTYPPMYGYVSDLFKGDNRVSGADINAALTQGFVTRSDINFLRPWDDMAGIHTQPKLYDSFAKLGYDTNNDGTITRLEWAPIGDTNPAVDGYEFDFDELYLGNNGAGLSGTEVADVNEQLQSDDPRPYVYIAVNRRQFDIFERIVNAAAADPANPRPFNLPQTAIDEIMQRLAFPPPHYDSFVLISVGPDAAQGTVGLLPEFGVDGFMTVAQLGPDNDAFQYHILGLAAYYMATRDADNNGELDFDFKARTRRGEAKNPNNDLPGRYPKAAGPLIYVGGV